MRRPLLAFIPHRGVVWTGVGRACLSAVRDDRAEHLMVTLGVSAHLSNGAWVAGEPEVWTESRRAGTTFPRRVPAEVPEGTDVTMASKAWSLASPGNVSIALDAGRAFVEPDRDGRAKARLEMTTVPGDTIAVTDSRGTLIEAKIDWVVRLRLDWLDGNYVYLAPHCVDVSVDVDEGRADFVFVGLVEATARKLDRVAVALLPLDQTDPWWAELPRAVFHRCALPEDLERGQPPTELTHDELTAARYLAWDIDEPPSRLLDEAEAAKIMRKLALGYERGEVLDAFGLESYEWQVEERAIAMSLAADVAVPEEAFSDQDPDDQGANDEPWSPAERFATSFDSQKIDSKARLDLAAFASLKARMEVGDGGALRQHSMTEASYAAEEDAWSARAEADPEVEQALSLELEKARSEAEVSLRERMKNWTGDSPSESEEAS